MYLNSSFRINKPTLYFLRHLAKKKYHIKGKKCTYYFYRLCSLRIVIIKTKKAR